MEERRDEKEKRCVKVARNLGISGCMTSSLAHLAGGYEVGSCTAPAAGAAWATLRCRSLPLSLFPPGPSPPPPTRSTFLIYDNV